jgi:hypothetical protein
MTLKDLFIGDSKRYKYGEMCRMSVPWRKTNAKLNFYSKGELTVLSLAAASISVHLSLVTCILFALVVCSHHLLHYL